ncbi:uncharacterized protein [Nicotiana tomentosiformis]|uniref:uncharacterized protein n=1 Tax=Nicotiana tomentosiformis TaxID=4098 RepID=UPI00388CBBFB
MKSTKVEIPSIRIIVETEIEDKDWVKNRLDQLTLIDEKRLATVCHGQLYQQRMARVYNKKVRPGKFEIGQLILRHILPPHEEAKGKLAPNWKSPYIVTRVLPKESVVPGKHRKNIPETTVNVDAVKRYYV